VKSGSDEFDTTQKMAGSGSGRWLSEKALAHLRTLPRVGVKTLKPPKTSDWQMIPRQDQGGRSKGFGKSGKSQEARRQFPAIGYEWVRTPMAFRTQKEPHYNYGYSAKRQYPPMSLKTLQLMIDTGRIDPSRPIDLAALCSSKIFPFNPQLQQFGVNLTDEGSDCFTAKVNLEVQWTNEQAIAAVERNGGVITTAYYDIVSVTALSNPNRWFQSGKPIPKRLTPPQDCVGFYSSAENRGYLADPRLIAEQRVVLGQKYGYEPPTEPQQMDEFLKESKDPKQVFYGLESGWIVDLKDKAIYKPTGESVLKYYQS